MSNIYNEEHKIQNTGAVMEIPGKEGQRKISIQTFN